MCRARPPDDGGARLVDERAAHDPAREAEERAAVREVEAFALGEAQPELVDEHGRLEQAVAPVAPAVGPCQLTQLGAEPREELAPRCPVALGEATQEQLGGCGLMGHAPIRPSTGRNRESAESVVRGLGVARSARTMRSFTPFPSPVGAARAASVTPTFAAGAVLLLGFGVALTPAGAQSSLDPPEPKSDHWVAPLKDGHAPSDLSHLSLEERIAYDQGLDDLFRSAVGTDGDGSTKLLSPNAGPAEAASLRSGVDPLRFYQMEVTPDGTLAVFGGTYKAMFSQDGASYIPFLGSSAPRSFPVTFRMLGASLGEEALAVDLSAAPGFDGTTAKYGRGACVERYDTRIGEIEQLFDFASLPGSGDLVVRLAVESELEGASSGDGLVWANELGGVSYSSAIAIDGNGRRVSVSTTLDGGVVELRVPASFVASAALPLTIDPVITTFYLNNSPSFADYEPDVAYDLSTNQLYVVWNRVFNQTDHDVWGEMFTLSGQPVAGSGAYIDYTPWYWYQAKVANNRHAAQFLVVATRSNFSEYEIYGRTRQAASTTQGQEFRISTGIRGKDSPDVGGDPTDNPITYYCVVWEVTFTFGVDHDIHARLVNVDSSLVGSSPILVDVTFNSYDKYPSVSKSNGGGFAVDSEWNVCWQRQYTPNDWDIRGAQIHHDGAIVHPSFSLDSSTANDFYPEASSSLDVTYGPRDYLVTYSRLDGADWDIYASAMRGSTRIAQANLSHLWQIGAATDEINPVVDTNGEHFALAYNRRYGSSATDFDVYVAGVFLSGNELRVSEGPLNLAFSSTFEGYSAICALRSGGAISDLCAVAWQDSSTPSTYGDVEGGIYALPAHFGQLGVDYCVNNPNSTGTFGVLSATGAGIASYNDLVLSASRLPGNSTLFFLTSQAYGSIANPGGSSGILCLTGEIGRFTGPGQVQNTGASGAAALRLNLQQHPTPSGLVSVHAGETWYFQAWHRDTFPSGGTTSLFTSASAVTFF